MRIARTAKVMFSEFLYFCSQGGGGSGQIHYLTNVPGIEHIMAIKVLMQLVVGGGGVSRQMHYLANVLGIEHILAIIVLISQNAMHILACHREVCNRYSNCLLVYLYFFSILAPITKITGK